VVAPVMAQQPCVAMVSLHVCSVRSKGNGSGGACNVLVGGVRGEGGRAGGVVVKGGARPAAVRVRRTSQRATVWHTRNVLPSVQTSVPGWGGWWWGGGRWVGWHGVW